MKKQLQKFFAKKKNNKGFTLIELIIVIAILAILIGIVGMASIRYVEKSRKSADEQTLDSVSTAAQAAIVDPDNEITVTDGEKATLTVKKDGTGDTAKWKVSQSGLTVKSGFDINTAVTNDLAKDLVLKSQAYKNGATCDITVTGDAKDATIKVGKWTEIKSGS